MTRTGRESTKLDGAHGVSVDEHGNITMPPGTVVTSEEAPPADDTEGAELSPDAESERAEPMPEAEPEVYELSPRPERPTRP